MSRSSPSAGSALVIESGIPIPARKSHNYHKPSPFRDVARRMQHGDSVVVTSRDLFRLATQINMSGASYTYERITEGVRVWKVVAPAVAGSASFEKSWTKYTNDC